MCPLNYVKISVVPFAILIFTLCLQNSGENTGLVHSIAVTLLLLCISRDPTSSCTNIMYVCTVDFT